MTSPSPADGSSGRARPAQSSLIVWWILGLLAAAPFVGMLLWSLETQRWDGIATLLATTVLVIFLLAACAPGRRSFFLLTFPFWILATGYAAYTIVFGVVPGRAAAMLLAGASWEEIAGLYQLWQQKWLTLPIVAALLAYPLLCLQVPSAPMLSRRAVVAGRLLLLLAVPLLVYTAESSERAGVNLSLNPVVGSLLFVGVRLPHARAELQGKLVVKTPFHARRLTAGEEVHVLIVGESARRASWSVYGYQRPTTPFLERLKADHEAIFLSHAMADANLTGLSVPMILTGMTPREIAAARPVGSNLLDLAKEAGYRTAWLVNQDVGVSTTIGVVADHLEFPPDLHEGPFGRSDLDEVLLPACRRELARTGQPRFIGMHVMGSHWEYYRRYPQSLERFGSPQRLALLTSATTDASLLPDLMDAYDNSVLYTDWFLEQVIEGARKLEVPATVSFIPDHGEAEPLLDDGAVGHGATHYVAAEFEIPALIWVNAAYRREYPDKVAALEANAATKEIRSHDFFYTVADLMGITWPGEAPGRSFASTSFVPDATREHVVRGVLTRRP
jgi:glucan phosphoethanolaminetransferase (alkaline phosphatase superfamily)